MKSVFEMSQIWNQILRAVFEMRWKHTQKNFVTIILEWSLKNRLDLENNVRQVPHAYSMQLFEN